MDPDRWERIQTLFHGAADLPGDAQRDFLESKAGDDPGLVADVLALLEEDARGTSLLDSNVAQVASRILTAETAAALPAGDFGPYEMKGVLGEGGMGAVFLAERRDLRSLVAIKILRDAWLSPARRERFASEQRMLARLNHPSIARLYDADVLPDGTPWFVMEYVQGAPLTTYCYEHAPTIERRLELLRAVCEAVQYAHRHLVIHRDLKPSNILVRQDGSVRLLDFGIAKQLASADTPVDQTHTGLRLMTPAYAAPEQIRGEPVGVYTDVYSLGVILYELLTGRLPFDLSSRTPGEAELIIVERDPERPSVVARRAAQSGHASVPAAGRGEWADLDVLCLTAMHKDPQRRYRTVEALMRDIDHYLRGEPLEARPDSARYRVAKFVRRHARPVAAAATMFVLVVALVVFYTVRLASARNAAVAQSARTERIQQFMLNLFQGGDEAAGPSDSLRVVTMIDRGMQEARALDAEPRVQAELYYTLGGIYQKLGSFSRADSLLRASLDRRRQIDGAQHPDVAASLVALGRLRDAEAKYDEAERLVREGLEMAQRTLRPGDPAIASATFALGQVLENRGDYERAATTLEEAARLQESDESPTQALSMTLSELANTHFYLGHYDVSDSLNRRVLAMDRKLYGERHPHIADDLINLGATQFERGRYPAAENFNRQALAIDEGWYGPNHQETASAQTILARTLVSEKSYDEATSLLRKALSTVERVYGPVHPRVASALNELGRVARERGDLNEAESDFRRMAEIYRRVYNDKHYVIGIALSNLAGVMDQRGQYVQAEAIFRDVLRRYADVLPAQHQLVAIAHMRLGRTLMHARRYATAEQESRAGLEMLLKLPGPSPVWLEYARTDLAAEYDSLGRPADAARIRTQMEAEKKSP